MSLRMVREKLRPALLLADQMVFSLGNFLTTVLATRLLAPNEFGVFSILMTANLIIVGLANTVVSEPIRVFGVDKENQTNPRFVLAQFLLRAISAVPVLFIAAVVALSIDSGNAPLAISFASFCGALLFHELARAINTSSQAWEKVLLGDFWCYASRLFGLLALARVGSPSCANIFWTMTVGSLVVVMLLPIRMNTARPLPPGYLRSVWSKNWNYGRWLMWESAVFSVSTQVYVFLVGATISVADAGGLVAAQTLVNLLNPLLIAATTAVTVSGRVALKNNGYQEWRALFIARGTLLFCAGAVACLLLVLLGGTFMRLLFPPALALYENLIPPLALAMLLTLCTSLMNAAFRTAEMPFVGFKAKLYSAVITTFAGYPLIQLYGVKGAAYGYVLTQVVWFSVYLNQLFVERQLSESSVKTALGRDER